MNSAVFPIEYFGYIYAAVIAFLFVFFILRWLRGRGKILVLVQYPDYEVGQWKKPETDHKTIVMEKAAGKKSGWHFEYDNTCVKTKRGFLGRQYRAIEVFPHATSAISFNHRLKETEQPKWDKEQSMRFINARMLEKMGNEPKEKTTAIQLIVIVLVVVNIAITLLTASGRLRL